VLLALNTAASSERRSGIIDYAREAGWILDNRLIAFMTHGLHAEYFASSQFDGVISLVSGETSKLLDTLQSLSVPIVDLWYDFPDWQVPRVWLDHRAAGRLGADHLLSLGIRQMLFYSHTVDRRVAIVRCEGFRAHCEQLHAEVTELWWEPKNSAGHKLGRIGWLAEHLKELPKPLGVLALNDVVAAEVIDAADLAGLTVPTEVAILGIDNDPVLTELGSVPLSSIDIARERVGYEAAALLDRLMRGESVPSEPVLVQPLGVVTRRSTETLAVHDADIARAARFIRDHFREPITVADVAAHTFLSRRRLQDRFQAAIGHGMNDEITRQRLDFARHLLTQTNHKISAIATLSGFSSVHRMAKVFQRVLSTTPQTYRQTYQPTRLQADRGGTVQKRSRAKR
jgi:LacI family transcriptional regulator